MGCDITFGANANEVAFFGPLHRLPVLGANPHMSRRLLKYREEARSHRAGSDTFRVNVENAIAPATWKGECARNRSTARFEPAHDRAPARSGATG